MFLGYNFAIMLKHLRVVGLLAVFINPAWTQVVGNGSHQSQETTTSSNSGDATAKTGCRSTLREDTASKQQDESKYKPYPWSELKAPANVPNWILSAIGICAVFAALRTLWAIKRQADLMERQIGLSINQLRPRLHLEPQPFTSLINGIPHVEIRVTNIGGSKAIFSTCIAGMEVTGLEVDIAFRKLNNSCMMKKLSNMILESEQAYDERIDVVLGAQIFPPNMDLSKPYKLHIYGVLNFRDIISEDTWFREFHYVLVNTPNVYMVQLGKMASEVWTPRMLEADRRIDKPIPPSWISKAWATCKAWQTRIDAEDQRQPDNPN